VPGDGTLERGAIGPDADARRSIGDPCCWEGLAVADRPVGDAGSALACEGCGVPPACVRWMCFGIGTRRVERASMADHPSARLWEAEAVALIAKSSPASTYPIRSCCR